VILAQLSHFASHTVSSLALFQEDQTVSFSPVGLWEHMAWMARSVAILLFIESIWSLAVMIDRYLYFSAARKQSREFAPKVAGALKDSKLEEAIKIAGRPARVPRFRWHCYRGDYREFGPRVGEG
jgi:biopolymer transport protein ExbB/biopolymer transport protein TolQ